MRCHRAFTLLMLMPVLVLSAVRADAGSPAADDLARGELGRALRDYERWTRSLAGDSIAALFAPDGELLREDGSALRGPAAIAAFLSGFKGFQVDSAVMSLEAIQVIGDDAVQWGTFSQTVRVPGQGTVRPRGRFVWQWHRQPDGRWKLRRSLTQPFVR
jgi:uncharacterized protein (TIGR02246 family)